ncbi:hypothetical protein F7734_00430 [Scytonema sp. UIC 10036]|uniref:hypothetical protein n=1 Tax=Scytonema sp. UIC 10036 TaxID=2304196 RepID=UPI0012DA7594|nr:hypothetical protein [Scytonema sp. UIC 10036]MUG91048.1 hypothetical protein [Scytonema sp. UIC 10036]
MTTFEEPQLPFHKLEPDPQTQSDRLKSRFDEAQSQSGEKLQHLAIEVQQATPLSPQRQRGLTKLIQEIWKQPTIGILKKSLRNRYWSLPNGLYEDLFNEALQETLVAMSRHIDNYQSQKSSFINWICGLLKNKFSDVYHKDSKKGIRLIPGCKNKNNDNYKEKRVLSLDELEEFIAENLISNHRADGKNNSSSDCDRLRELLINDPDNIFKTAHVRGKPHASFQNIAIAIYVEGKNMQQLSTELSIPYSTLDCFFKRKLKKLETYFQENLQL